MIIEVVPIKRLPRGIGDTFSYNVPFELKSDIRLGQIVEIDFRNRLRLGLVKGIHADSDIKRGLKAINKIIYPQPLVTPEQMRLASWISNYYFTSLATATRLVVPAVPGKITNYKLQITKKNQNLKSKSKKELIWWDDELSKNQKIIKTINPTLKQGRQVLWLWPEKYLTAQIPQNFVTVKKDNKLFVLTWQKYTSKTKFFKQYLNILTGKSRLIIGTRSALFAPYNNLGLVIVEDEANSLYKSEITPRYQARAVAEELARQHGAKLLLVSPAPSLETISSHQEFIAGSKTLHQSDNLKIIDLKEERHKENYSSLSDELKEAIEAAIHKGKNAFLLHNRLGHSPSVICKNCGLTLLCSNCHLPLNYHAKINLLVCHHCRYRQELPPFCPECGSADLKMTGQGIEKLEQEIKKIFAWAKVISLDSSSSPNVKSKISNRKFDKKVNSEIILGTEYALHANRVNWADTGLIGVINVDRALYRPDFRASERMYQLLNKLISMVSPSLNSGQALSNYDTTLPQGQSDTRQAQGDKIDILIQTYNPENFVIKAIEQNKPELFYVEELKLRKALKYPPYFEVIKLIYKNKDEKKAVGEAMHIYNRLRKHLLKNSKIKSKKVKFWNVEILKPFPAFERKERGKFKFHLILRVMPNAPEPLYEKIRQLVPPDWIFDRDPETLL